MIFLHRSKKKIILNIFGIKNDITTFNKELNKKLKGLKLNTNKNSKERELNMIKNMIKMFENRKNINHPIIHDDIKTKNFVKFDRLKPIDNKKDIQDYKNFIIEFKKKKSLPSNLASLLFPYKSCYKDLNSEEKYLFYRFVHMRAYTHFALKKKIMLDPTDGTLFYQFYCLQNKTIELEKVSVGCLKSHLDDFKRNFDKKFKLLKHKNFDKKFKLLKHRHFNNKSKKP